MSQLSLGARKPGLRNMARDDGHPAVTAAVFRNCLSIPWSSSFASFTHQPSHEAAAAVHVAGAPPRQQTSTTFPADAPGAGRRNVSRSALPLEPGASPAAVPVHPKQAAATERLRRGTRAKPPTLRVADSPLINFRHVETGTKTGPRLVGRRSRRERAPESTASRFSRRPLSCSPDRQVRRTYLPARGCSRWIGSSPSRDRGRAVRLGASDGGRRSVHDLGAADAADRAAIVLVLRAESGKRENSRRRRPSRGAGSVSADRHRGLRWSSDRQGSIVMTNSQRVWRQNTRGDFWTYTIWPSGRSPQARSRLRALDAHVRQALARRPHGGLRRQEQHLRREPGRRRGARADHGRHRRRHQRNVRLGQRGGVRDPRRLPLEPRPRPHRLLAIRHPRRARVHHDQQHGRALSADDLVQASQGRPAELGRARGRRYRRRAGRSSG